MCSAVIYLWRIGCFAGEARGQTRAVKAWHIRPHNGLMAQHQLLHIAILVQDGVLGGAPVVGGHLACIPLAHPRPEHLHLQQRIKLLRPCWHQRWQKFFNFLTPLLVKGCAASAVDG